MNKSQCATSLAKITFNPIAFLILAFMGLGLMSCASSSTHSNKSNTLSDINYEKGLAAYKKFDYPQASESLLKILQNPAYPDLQIYDESLWMMSVIYEKQAQFEQALLALNELEQRQRKIISPFKVRLAQIKNYYRVQNSEEAQLIRQKIDQAYLFTQNSSERYPLSNLFEDLSEVAQLNYDQHILAEIDFINEIQKYFFELMTCSDEKINQSSFELLTQIDDVFMLSFKKDYLNQTLKRSLAIKMIDHFEGFQQLSRENLTQAQNSKTMSLFLNYAEQKQKILIDWLHHDNTN